MRAFTCVLLLLTTSCVSDRTTASRTSASLELDASPIGPPKGQSVLGAGAGCVAIARAAAARHPSVLAARERGRASLARSGARGSLPPPKASFEIWDFPIGDPATADEDGMYMLGLAQEFPAPGVRSGEARSESELARASAAESRDRARMFFSEVAHACVDWAGAAAAREKWKSYVGVVREARDASVAGFAAGAPLAGVARLDAELAGAERKLGAIDERATAARSALEALVGGLVGMPAEPPALELAPVVDAPEPSVDRGDVQAARARLESARAQADAAESLGLEPDVEVRGTYMQTPGARAGAGAMVGVSLPWLWGPGGASEDAAQHDVRAAQAELEGAERTARADVARAAGRVRVLRRGLELLSSREIPSAQRAVEAQRASATGSAFDLTEWLQAAFTLRQAWIDEVESREALAHALIDLDVASGLEAP